MKERPIILIPVMPAIVLERLEPMMQLISEREKIWEEKLSEYDGLPVSPFYSQMHMFCERIRRLHALASIACGPFNILEDEANFLGSQPDLSKGAFFDRMVSLAEMRKESK